MPRSTAEMDSEQPQAEQLPFLQAEIMGGVAAQPHPARRLACKLDSGCQQLVALKNDDILIDGGMLFVVVQRAWRRILAPGHLLQSIHKLASGRPTISARAAPQIHSALVNLVRRGQLHCFHACGNGLPELG